MTSTTLRTLERGLDVLAMCLAKADKRRCISVHEVIITMQVPRSTAYRMIKVLRDRGFLRPAEKPGFFTLGEQFSSADASKPLA